MELKLINNGFDDNLIEILRNFFIGVGVLGIA